jgi:hypothetical protein
MFKFFRPNPRHLVPTTTILNEVGHGNAVNVLSRVYKEPKSAVEGRTNEVVESLSKRFVSERPDVTRSVTRRDNHGRLPRNQL